jgi:hypothetical protein
MSRISSRISKPISPDNNISKDGAKKLSEYRRAEIRDAVTNKAIEEESPTNPQPVLSHSASWNSTLRKQATSTASVSPTAHGSTDMMGPDVYSPLFLMANLNLPRDRVTMNAWNRVFYDTHPLVRNAINLHASYPISKIHISHPVKEVQEFFQEMAERIDLYNVVYSVALEFFKLGEVIAYAELDKDNGTWKRITVLNPDYVHIKKPVVGEQSIISLKPDASLARLVNSNDPGDIALKRRLPRHIIDSVKKGQMIPLDNFNASHLKLLSSPYDIRGTSMIVSIYKDLMLYDKIRECKFVQSNSMINPLTLVKVGSETYKATQGDLDAMRLTLEEAQYDKDFKIITHDGVTIERVGFSGATLDTTADMEQITNNIYAGLMVPRSLIEQEGASYASSSVGLEVLRQRYDIFRNMIKKWLEQKIFAPICELQEFFVYKDGEKVLQVPTIDFNHMNLYDMNDYVQNIGTFVGNKQISVQTLYRSLGLSYEEEKRRLKEEAIDMAIATKQAEILSGMRLRDLEALEPDSVIPEPAEMAPGAPGGASETELPGMGGGLGGGMEMPPPGASAPSGPPPAPEPSPGAPPTEV